MNRRGDGEREKDVSRDYMGWKRSWRLDWVVKGRETDTRKKRKGVKKVKAESKSERVREMKIGWLRIWSRASSFGRKFQIILFKSTEISSLGFPCEFYFMLKKILNIFCMYMYIIYTYTS